VRSRANAQSWMEVSKKVIRNARGSRSGGEEGRLAGVAQQHSQHHKNGRTGGGGHSPIKKNDAYPPKQKKTTPSRPAPVGASKKARGQALTRALKRTYRYERSRSASLLINHLRGVNSTLKENAVKGHRRRSRSGRQDRGAQSFQKRSLEPNSAQKRKRIKD